MNQESYGKTILSQFSDQSRSADAVTGKTVQTDPQPLAAGYLATKMLWSRRRTRLLTSRASLRFGDSLTSTSPLAQVVILPAPPQVMVNVAYFQPTPCYQLRVEPSGPNAQNQINLKAYAIAEKDKPCSLMALSTPLQASLNLGSLPKGHYTVFLNGNQIGEFDL